MQDSDEVIFVVEHDEDFTHFLISVTSRVSMTPEEFVAAMQSLVNDIQKDPEEFFSTTTPLSTPHH